MGRPRGGMRRCSSCGGPSRNRVSAFPVTACSECSGLLCAKHVRYVEGVPFCPAHLKALPAERRREAVRGLLGA